MPEGEMVTVGIETSCDDTCVAVLRGDSILSNLVSSQVDLHAQYGGVVPELAARAHAENILPLMIEAFREAGITSRQVNLVAVTRGPGLVGALLVGVAAAKALSWSQSIPLVGVNHLEGHVYAHRLDKPDMPLGPSVCLVVSGGHTELLQLDSQGRPRVLGRALDDAAGEAFDKIARLLELGYPGGPEIDRLARRGSPEALNFPRAWLDPGSLDFSFSGLKTSVAVHVERYGTPRGQALYDLLASFQEAVVDVLVNRAVDAAKTAGVEIILVSGGVAANSRLRERLLAACEAEGLLGRFPPPYLCTDNASMIAAAGLARWQRGQWDDLSLGVEASLRADGWLSGEV